MFEKQNNNVRKYQCFVCGQNYETLEIMNEHIVDVHEEGREFIQCPVCNSCVRCMKTHFKVKHPQRALPTGIQHKVAIWRDFKPDGRKASTKKPTFRTGEFMSAKNGNIPVHYRSGMECHFLECLESDKDVIAFAAEPFRVPYFFNGEWHEYIPDLKIQFIDSSIEIWEIKPSNQTEYAKNQAKWAAMNNYALNFGWEFVVQTEVGLGKLRAKVKRQLNE